ncbi:MAG: MaoC/PaaZ C-terminal domain-containing protein, partial [Myxococcota bacterium]|nr:MaoC/PaaZ C-terminal domain-containing protein [Myxococcota bacterium]
SELQLFFFSAATNNGHRIHYDLPYAKTEGLPNILVQGPLQAALLAKALTDWIGPGGRLTRIQIQNRGNAFPNETLHYGGVVVGKRKEEGQHFVDCEIFERNEGGAILMPGTATVSLPRRPGA